jgi:hypothetical protein
MEATLRTQLEAFANGIILDSDGKQSTCYNFYDWFCNTTSLKNKAKALFPKVKRFLKSHPEINLDTHYVFFKNNCPMVGSLYDDFRIVDIESGNVVFTVTPFRIINPGKRYGHSYRETKSEIWGRSNDFKQPIKEGKTFLDLFK